MLRSILIAGGGTAGWLSACYLAQDAQRARAGRGPHRPGRVARHRHHRRRRRHLPLDPRHALADRHRRGALPRETGATFKQGIRFVDWVRPPGTRGTQITTSIRSTCPSARGDGLDLLPYWLLGEAGDGVAFADAVTMQKRVADAGRAPKRLGDADFDGADELRLPFRCRQVRRPARRAGRALGVDHHLATVERVELAERRRRSQASARANTARCSADLYVDCTGLRAALIGKALGSPFRARSRTCCSSIGPWRSRCPMRSPTRRSPRTRSPPPTKPAGPGTSACRSGAASATSIRRDTPTTTRAEAGAARLHRPGRGGSRRAAAEVRDRLPADAVEARTASPSACRRASSSRWSPPASA